MARIQNGQEGVLILHPIWKRHSNMFKSTAEASTGLSHPFFGMGPGPLELGKISLF